MCRRPWASFFLVVIAGCRSAPQQIQPRNIIAISPSSGGVSSKLVSDPDSPELKLGPGEEYVAPQLSRANQPPAYPADLLPLNLPRRFASVRVTFGEDGRVVAVIPSPIGETTHDPYEAAFQSAVELAVRKWICYPASIRKFRDGPDTDGDGKPDYRILSAQRVLKTFFDVTFTFEVVSGHPVVKSDR